VTLRLVRTWLPIIVVAVGFLLWAINPSTTTAEGSAHIIGAGIAIWILNILFRIGVKGDIERDEEDAARTFFDQHGYWPDEEPPARPHPPRHRRSGGPHTGSRRPG
jgi:hypothetical protein